MEYESQFEKNIYIKLGKNLKNFREEKGLTQEVLSSMLNVNDKYIGHVERFERHISLKRLIKLSSILNVSVKDFFK